MKTALVHDWLITIGGAEKTFKEIYELFPSPIYTLLQDTKKLRGSFFEKKEIKTSFIQKLPWSEKKYRFYLPLFPLAVEQFDLSSYDLVLSSSHCAAKGVMTHSDQVHICYCYTPMRYAWDLYQQYLKENSLKKGIKASFAKFFLHYLRMWDLHATPRVDAFIGISHYVAKRIRKIYNREAAVIYPPIDTSFFTFCDKKEDFYLTASRMVPYKKIDLIVEAFSHMPDKKLVVIGDGPEMKKIKAKARKNIEILGYQSDAVLKEHLQKAKAFVFAAIEDFGILPVEAQSCGTPVIAFAKGSIKETVVDKKTGIFFHKQNVKSLVEAVEEFGKRQETLDPYTIRCHAEKFSKERFKKEFKSFIDQKYSELIL